MADTEDRDRRELRFHWLYQANYASMAAYAVNRTGGSADDAADIVAEVFTIAWRRLDDVPAPPEDRLWLYGTARRVISRHYRSADRLRRLVNRVILRETVTGRPALHAQDPGHDRLLAALGRLRPGDREALLLLYWEELSYAEAATVLGCSANAVGIRAHRAKARLRQALAAGAPTGAELAALSLDQGPGY